MNSQTNSPTIKRAAHSLTGSADCLFSFHDSTNIAVNDNPVSYNFSVGSQNNDNFEEVSDKDKKEFYEKAFGKGIL